MRVKRTGNVGVSRFLLLLQTDQKKTQNTKQLISILVTTGQRDSLWEAMASKSVAGPRRAEWAEPRFPRSRRCFYFIHEFISATVISVLC